MFQGAKVYSGFAVDDVGKAREFYGETLGLNVEDGPPGLFLNLEDGHQVLVYEKPDFSPSTYTVLHFEVPDVEAVVDKLTSQGVEMERYEGFNQDEKGIARMPDFPPGAWFTDPAGNIVGALEPMTG